MARSCGIRLGPRTFELFVLEGGARSQKIVSYKLGTFDPPGREGSRAPSEILKAAAKECKIPHDNVNLVIDSGFAAFRHVTLPFEDASKINAVLRYEVEGQLPQFNIDDVVIDFHPLREQDGATDVLVTAVPKDDLSAALELCERAGIEPLEAQLETSAMVNAATASNICNIDDAQLLVHVGDHSTSVVVMDSGVVREMRVIHIGALTPTLAAGADGVLPGESAELDSEAETDASDGLDAHEIRRRTEAALRRIRRELGRTLSGARTINTIEAIYICGIEMPGLIGDPILDTPVYLLDCFDEAETEAPAEGFGQLVVAYGAAVTQLGGGLVTPSLRRDELAFTGTWERIEFPVAVLSMLLVTLVGVVWILQDRQLDRLENHGFMFWLQSNNNYLVGDPAKGHTGEMGFVPDDFRARLKRFRPAKGESVNYDKELHKAFDEIEQDLQARVLKLSQELGGGTADQPQSAFLASDLVLGVLNERASDWRVAIHNLKANFQPARSTDKQDSVKVELDIVFFGDDVLDATGKYEAFRASVKDQPWLVQMDEKRSDELESGKGISIQGLPIVVNVAAYEELVRQQQNQVQGG